jgi:hypothetical protein
VSVHVRSRDGRIVSDCLGRVLIGLSFAEAGSIDSEHGVFDGWCLDDAVEAEVGD